MYIILFALLTVLPEPYQGVWHVSHEYDFITQEYVSKAYRPLRAEKDHFKLADGTELHFDKVIKLDKGHVILLKNGDYVIVTSGPVFLASWHRYRDGERREEYRRWLVHIK